MAIDSPFYYMELIIMYNVTGEKWVLHLILMSNYSSYK